MKSRRIKFALAFVLLLGGGYTGVTLWKNAAGAMPPELADARIQGALISETIVDLSEKSTANLGTINQLDKERKYEEALTLSAEVITQSQEIRDQAVALSEQIGIMTKSLSQVRSFEARQTLLEAITNRLALLSRLINYSAYLGQLVDVLRNHFTGVAFQKGDVEKLINQINAEVQAINSFDAQAKQAMEKFDKILDK